MPEPKKNQLAQLRPVKEQTKVELIQKEQVFNEDIIKKADALELALVQKMEAKM